MINADIDYCFDAILLPREEFYRSVADIIQPIARFMSSVIQSNFSTFIGSLAVSFWLSFRRHSLPAFHTISSRMLSAILMPAFSLYAFHQLSLTSFRH